MAGLYRAQELPRLAEHKYSIKALFWLSLPQKSKKTVTIPGLPIQAPALPFSFCQANCRPL